MKKCFLLLLISFLASCSDEEFVTKEYSANNQNANTIEQNIHDYIRTFRKVVSRNAADYKLSPFVYEGDTVMHIANYGNGWDLFSNDKRMPMLVMSSDSGNFDMNDANMPPSMKSYIYSVADEIHQLRAIDEAKSLTYGEWNIVSIENEEVDLANVISGPRAIGNAQPGEGYWKLIEVSDTVWSESVTNRRTTTQWGQGYPWNVYVPNAKDDPFVQGPAGCTSVAVGQYLYYLHYKDNKPETTITTAVYNQSEKKYVFSGSSSTIWDEMAQTQWCSGTDAVAKFIAYIGEELDTEYYSDMAGASFEKSIEVINAQTGYNYYKADMNYAYVANELLSGRAVLAMAEDNTRSNTNKGGHEFIIDRLKTKTAATTSTYGWVGTDNYGRDTNLYDMEGNVIGYSFFYEDENIFETHSFMMNWGWNGRHNNSWVFAKSDEDWHVDYHYNVNRKIARKN